MSLFSTTLDPDIGTQAPARASGRCAVPNSLRSQGELRLAFGQRGGRTVLKEGYQSGCLRARLPRREEAGRPCAVLINTAGGLAEGDSVRQSVRWAPDTAATVTGQAAEKVYRALSRGCRIETELRVEQGADAEWLPQETILFDRARLARETRILLDGDVTFLGLEAVVLGRAAMGERMAHGALSDRLRIYRNGRLIYADALALEGEVDAMMRRSAIGDGAGAMAVIVHASDRAAALLQPVREALAAPSGRAAVSAWNGLLAIRLLAPDGAALRADIMAALAALREGRPLPRVWRC